MQSLKSLQSWNQNRKGAIMTTNKNYFFLGCIFFVIAIGCAGVSRVHIGTITDDPGRYNNQKVVIQGKVVETFALPFLEQGICKINDGSGEIWVKPRKRVPLKGENIRIVGTVKVGLTLANKSFGVMVIEEKEKEE